VYISRELAEGNREKIRAGGGIWDTVRQELRDLGDKHLALGRGPSPTGRAR
jgi:hypothetical protein